MACQCHPTDVEWASKTEFPVWPCNDYFWYPKSYIIHLPKDKYNPAEKVYAQMRGETYVDPWTKTTLGTVDSSHVDDCVVP